MKRGEIAMTGSTLNINGKDFKSKDLEKIREVLADLECELYYAKQDHIELEPTHQLIMKAIDTLPKQI